VTPPRNPDFIAERVVWLTSAELEEINVRTRIASAGTGKTTALVQEILHLVRSGVPLRRIAAVTYTRKAATEFRTRIHSALRSLTENKAVYDIHPYDIPDTKLHEAIAELDANTVGTIHAFMRRLAMITAPELSLDPNFTLINEYDAQIMYAQELDTLEYLREITVTQNDKLILTNLFEQRSLNPNPDAGNCPNTERLLDIHRRVMMAYRSRLNNQRLSPNDLEYVITQAASNPVITERWRERVTDVLVDESQDVNPTQAKFIAGLEAAGVNILMVGDPKQSIYSFRQADVDSFRLVTNGSVRLSPLTVSFRHSSTVNRFLNRFCGSLAGAELGFLPSESPVVSAARDVVGSVSVRWVVGGRFDKLDDLREVEAHGLVDELVRHHEGGVPFGEMSVLTRARSSQGVLLRVFRERNVPHVVIQGRDYYSKTEIRDLFHALSFVHNGNSLSLSVVLTSSFCGLSSAELFEVLRAEDRLGFLEVHHPVAFGVLVGLLALRNGSPQDVLHEVAYGGLLGGGGSFAGTLTGEQVDNVDAVMTLLNPGACGSLGDLTAAFRGLFGQEDAGVVPQGGDGVRVATIHASKGLEWRVVGVFDMGRGSLEHRPVVIVEPTTGLTAVQGSPHYEALLAAVREREVHELHRLSYVAYSRARDHLVISGSVKGDKWNEQVRVLAGMRVGPGTNLVADGIRIVSTSVEDAGVVGGRVVGGVGGCGVVRFPLGSYSGVVFPHVELPLVRRPSHASVVGEDSLEFFDRRYNGEVDDGVISEAVVVGTLTHHAIGEGWLPSDPSTVQVLGAQAILAPLPLVVKDRILAEAVHLLEHHSSMVGTVIPSEDVMDESFREVPFSFRDGDGVVWSGVIDHLFRVGGRWFVHDYKSDHTIVPDAHVQQMRLYHSAVLGQVGVGESVTAQLVYLRHRTLVTVPLVGDPVVVPPVVAAVTTPASAPVVGRRLLRSVGLVDSLEVVV
jgi:ATP-dependent exoDNAse (exonuclease V) beta subunit